MERVTIEVGTPVVADLPRIVAELSGWQDDDWPGHLHPGDLGWHSMVGAEQTASHLRIWTSDASLVAVGMLDGNVFRMALDPSAVDDEVLAARIARDLPDPAAGVITSSDGVIEARGARALLAQLRRSGWVDDEPWTPLCRDLTGPVEPRRSSQADLRVESVGPEKADVWVGVHWSAFRGTPLDEETHERLTQRWITMATGPFAGSGHHLIGYDTRDAPVAVTSVWTAGPGRPGLIEPMGVHRDHHGHGYGSAITLAGAYALQHVGASNAVVVAENANEAALATYIKTGFAAQQAVTDLRR